MRPTVMIPKDSMIDDASYLLLSTSHHTTVQEKREMSMTEQVFQELLARNHVFPTR